MEYFLDTRKRRYVFTTVTQISLRCQEHDSI